MSCICSQPPVSEWWWVGPCHSKEKEEGTRKGSSACGLRGTSTNDAFLVGSWDLPLCSRETRVAGISQHWSVLAATQYRMALGRAGYLDSQKK